MTEMSYTDRSIEVVVTTAPTFCALKTDHMLPSIG